MSALEAFPGELAIVPYRGGWKLLITGPKVYGEVITGRRDHLERIADAYAELRRGEGPRLSMADMTLLYFDGIDLAHLKHPAASGIFCDEDAPTDAMRGTGSQEEREWAAYLVAHGRSCRVCVHRAAALRVAR